MHVKAAIEGTIDNGSARELAEVFQSTAEFVQAEAAIIQEMGYTPDLMKAGQDADQMPVKKLMNIVLQKSIDFASLKSILVKPSYIMPWVALFGARKVISIDTFAEGLSFYC